jgi:hypothetical protein
MSAPATKGSSGRCILVANAYACTQIGTTDVSASPRPRDCGGGSYAAWEAGEEEGGGGAGRRTARRRVVEGQADGGTSGGGEAQALAVANAIASSMLLETMRFERNEKYCSQKANAGFPVQNASSCWTEPKVEGQW